MSSLVVYIVQFLAVFDNPTAARSNCYTGLEELLINWSPGDKSRVHIHSVELRKIALQHMWGEITRVWIFIRMESSLKCVRQRTLLCKPDFN